MGLWTTSSATVAFMKRHTFCARRMGRDWHPDFAPQADDIVVKEHWGSSGFANTDLDMQLKQHSIRSFYHHRVVRQHLYRDHREVRPGAWLSHHPGARATAAFSPEMMYAAHELNGPTYAHAIIKTSELIAALPAA